MSNSIMRKIAKFIVEKHIIIMLLFVVLVIYSALSISKVRVNEDITAPVSYTHLTLPTT